MIRLFDRFTTGCARFFGRPQMLSLCLLLSLCGIGAEIYRHDQWVAATSLAINIVTLMMLPILQATQNRDGAALQAKLDELIKANGEARDTMIGLENRGEDEIEEMRADHASHVTGK